MLKEIGIDGIYIVHAEKGYEYHEKRINKLFAKHHLEFEFITDGDPSIFNTDKNLLKKYFISDIESRLSKGVLSCTLNHILAYERIVKNKNKYAIIFENDPFFLGNFNKKLMKFSEEMNELEKGFIISLENSTLLFPSYWRIKKNKYLYKASAGRMAGAYIIDFEGASNALIYLETNKCDTVIDWWHNNLINDKVIKMYWAHPPLVEQGSHNGLLNSTISSKPKSLNRRFKWIIQKYYKTYFKRLFKQKRIY